MPSASTRPLGAYILLIIAMLLWGSSFVAQKIAFEAFHPFHVVFGRLLIATLGFVVLIRHFRKVRLRMSDLPWLLLMALFEPCLYFIFESYALTLTTASEAGMITATLPLLVFIGAYFFFQERMSWQMIAGCTLAIAGAAWLSLASDASEQAPNPQLGNLLEFVAMICAAGYTLVLKHLSYRFSAAFLTAMQALIGTLFFTPFVWIYPWPDTLPLQPSLAIVYLGIVVSMGAYGLYNYGVGRIPASQASTFINLIPVFTLLLAYLVLQERLNLWQWLACGLVFCGVFLSQFARRTESST